MVLNELVLHDMARIKARMSGFMLTQRIITNFARFIDWVSKLLSSRLTTLKMAKAMKGCQLHLASSSRPMQFKGAIDIKQQRLFCHCQHCFVNKINTSFSWIAPRVRPGTSSTSTLAQLFGACKNSEDIDLELNCMLIWKTVFVVLVPCITSRNANAHRKFNHDPSCA